MGGDVPVAVKAVRGATPVDVDAVSDVDGAEMVEAEGFAGDQGTQTRSE